jgi:S1/P1 Nuclease
MTHLLLALAIAVASVQPLFAAPAAATATKSARRWDATGHRAMAAIAYDRLRPRTRARVDAILRAHPDIANLGEGLDLGTPAGIREVFLRASVWPDRIRGDARFYRDSDANARPTPLLPGFPSMARHDNWHYLTRSFSTDGTATITLAEPNVATLFPSLAQSLGNNAVAASVRAYNLSWIIHVVGDLHQPLHGTSRSAASHPTGDAGGNGVWVRLRGYELDSINLHSVWDGWVGRPARDTPIDDVATSLARDLPMAVDARDDALHIPRGVALAATVRGWADESATLARYVAYDLPARSGSALPELSDHYVERGTRIARQRLALSAYRLAAVLEAQLGR